MCVLQILWLYYKSSVCVYYKSSVCITNLVCVYVLQI